MTNSTLALEANGLAKHFGRKWALRECTLQIPTGKVVALVGPNGAGKSTLLRLAVGLDQPSEGSVSILGGNLLEGDAGLLGRIGYLDQDRPLLRGFRVAEMLRFGAGTNPRWDDSSAHTYVAQLGIDLHQRVDSLSGGQQAQIALAMCLSKHPELLILDEPAAALDPMAREDLLRLLMQRVADSGASVILSTHALADVAAVCNYLVILASGRVRLCDDIDYILESHRILSATPAANLALPAGSSAIDTHQSGREVSHLARLELPVSDARWTMAEATLEEIVLAYLRQSTDRPTLVGDPAHRPGASQ